MSVKERFIFYLSSKFKRSLLYIAILSATIDVLQFIKKILKSDKKIISKNRIQFRCRLAPVLKIIFLQNVISYTCSFSYSDGSVLKQSHQSKTSYKYMI